MELTVKLGLAEHTEPQNGRKTIRIEVTNIGDQPIGRIGLAFEYEYESPQDVSSEFAAHPGRTLHVEELGRQMEFCPAARDEGPLAVGQSRLYLYPAEWYPAMESLVASLSPERYRVTIVMDGHKEIAVSGEVFGEFLTGLTLGK